MDTFPLEISQYKLGHVIGRGATSEVYYATCLKNGCQLAIKVIDLETCPIEIDNLRAEVAFWSNCKHPNVVEYYGSFVDKSILYILMEYMSGGSCYEIMRYKCPRGIGNEAIIATILREVLKSLAYFHENRQLHRDVKAGNILVNEKGEVKIADFGIAANLLEQGQRKRARFTVIGTPCYMAPEILAAGIGYTEKADIWSLGITAIELATGSAPYANLYPLEVIVRISNSPPPTLPEDRGFSPAFKDFVKQCLQQVASKRSSAAQLLESKFIKTATTNADIAKFLIDGLPPLEERFLKVHQNPNRDQSTQEGGSKKKSEHKSETIDWNFGDDDQSAPSAPKSGQETPKISPEPSIDLNSTQGKSSETSSTEVVKKGKFTITKQNTSSTDPEDQKILMMENEVSALRGRIQRISGQNDDIRKQIGQLKAQIKEIE